MNHLHFGDNLSVLQEMSDNTVNYCMVHRSRFFYHPTL